MSAHLKLITSTYMSMFNNQVASDTDTDLLYDQPGVGLRRHLLLIISSFKKQT